MRRVQGSGFRGLGFKGLGFKGLVGGVECLSIGLQRLTLDGALRASKARGVWASILMTV